MEEVVVGVGQSSTELAVPIEPATKESNIIPVSDDNWQKIFLKELRGVLVLFMVISINYPD